MGATLLLFLILLTDRLTAVHNVQSVLLSRAQFNNFWDSQQNRTKTQGAEIIYCSSLKHYSMAKKLQLVITCKVLSFIISLFQLQVKTRENPAFTRRLRDICHSQTPNPMGKDWFLFRGTANCSGWALSREEVEAPLAQPYHLDCFFHPHCHCCCPNKWLPGQGPEEAVGDHRLLLRQFPLGKKRWKGMSKTTLSSDLASKWLNSLLPLLPSKELPPEEQSRGVSQIFQSPFKLPLSLLVLFS